MLNFQSSTKSSISLRFVRCGRSKNLIRFRNFSPTRDQWFFGAATATRRLFFSQRLFHHEQCTFAQREYKKLATFTKVKSSFFFFIVTKNVLSFRYFRKIFHANAHKLSNVKIFYYGLEKWSKKKHKNEHISSINFRTFNLFIFI